MGAVETYRTGFVDGAAAYYKLNGEQAERIAALEQLCHDLYIALLYEKGYEAYMTTRMEQLGLLEDERRETS